MTETKKDRTRDYIIEAAGSLFGKYGYNKTSLGDIALATRKTKTAVYHYFKNKEDVFRAVIEKEAGLLTGEILKAINKQNEPEKKLKAYIMARMEALKKVSVFYDAMKNELLDHLDLINSVREKYSLEEVRLVKSILAEGKEKKKFTLTNIDLTAVTLVTVLKGLELPLFVSDPTDADKKLNEFIRIVCNGLVKN